VRACTYPAPKRNQSMKVNGPTQSYQLVENPLAVGQTYPSTFAFSAARPFS